MSKILISFIIFVLLFIPQTVNAITIAKQTDQFSDSLNVWQMIQELGDNLSGTVGSFTFRVSTSRSNLNQFDYTAQNSKIYDKTTNTTAVPYGCLPLNSNPADHLRGLTFNTNGVPAGFEDVTINFSCHNFSFIPGHRYLIFITNANRGNEGSGNILFASAAYGNNPTEFFPQGGLRYANGNPFDFFHNTGSCNPITYIWNDPIANPVSGCNIFSSSKDDLYFILSNTAPEPPPPPPPVPAKTPLILIPGIGGSELKTEGDAIWSKDDGHGGTFNHAYAKDEKVWVNEGEAGNPGNDDYFDVLRMKTDGVNSEANLGLTGNLYSGAYGGAINFFTTNGYTLNQDFFVFPYDWRKDIGLTKDLLDQKIQQIKTQTESSKVDIVAHSMGGLVARNYIADPAKASNIRKLFTLGTPHLGAVKFLKALRFGDCIIYGVGPFCLSIAPTELNDVVQNLISGYELTPSQTYFNFYSDEDSKHPYPYRTENGSLNYNQIKTLLTNFGHNTPLFNPGETFHTVDNSLSNANGVEVTIVAGSGIQTLGQIIEKTITTLNGNKITHKDKLDINGDKTVPLLSASISDPHKGLFLNGSAQVFYTNQEHKDLVTQGSALNLVKNILNGDNNLPNGVSTQPYKLTGHSLSVHSPVNIHVYDVNNNHTGPLPNGDFEVNIPGSSYDTLNDAKFIFLPEDGQYTIKFEATDQGSFDLKIRKYEDDVNTQTILYKDVPLTNSTKAQTTLDTNSSQPPVLQVDQDGNGTVDSQVNSSTTLTGNASYDETPPQTTIQLSGTQGNNNWYKSDVLVTLAANDETNGSGVDKIEYTLDNGQTINTYTSPFTISQEGIFKLKVKSVDKAGNSETPKELEIKIDKTPPEATVQFNLTTQNLEINGNEITPGEIILQDEAGNITKLQVEPKDKKRKEKLEIKTISYNENPAIKLLDNKFEVKFKTDKKSEGLKEFEQKIKIKEEEKIKAEYDRKKNITKIEIKENKEKKQKIEKDGIVLLQLKTNKGQLETNF